MKSEKRILKCNKCGNEIMTTWIPDVKPCECGGRWRTARFL